MFKKSVTATTIFIGIFAGLFVANSALINSTYAYELTVTTSGDTIIEPQNGQVITKTSEITVKTDCRAGYTLQIQGPTDTNLYLDGDATKNETDKYIKPVNATSALNAQPNTYGYSLIPNQTNQIFTPLTSTAVTLKDLTQTASPSANIDDTTNIYWGVNAGTDLVAGTYQMTNNGAVTYIITNSPTCVNYTVDFDKNSATATGTMNPQPISVNIPTKLEPNQFTNNSAFLGWNTKPDGTGTAYTNEEEVLDLALAEQSITLYAQWDTCLFNSVCYQGNGADAGLTMADQTTDATATTTTLWAPNFKRAGYGFVSWNTKPDGTGTDYGPNQTIDQTLTKDGLRLYAKWLQSDGTPLQDWGGCASLNIGDSIALTDTRDNDAYTVTKLADDNCWMTENLRLGGSSSIALTTGNTDTSTNFSLNASTSTDWNSELSLNNTDRILLNADNTINSSSEMTSPDNNVYAYGNYYNWYTATAKTGDYNMNSVTTSSICPKGWSLPTGDNANPKSFAYLNIKLGGTDGPAVDNPTLSNRYRSYPNNFVYSGYYDSSNTIELRGTRSSITSASPWSGSDTEILYLWLDDTNVSPAIRSSLVSTYGHKYEGYAVRCITTNTQVSSYTVKFDANGGTGDMLPVNIVRDQSTALPANTFTAPDGQAFNKWNTASDGSGTSYTNEQLVNNLIPAGESITLYAQWGISLENAYAKAGKTQVTIGGNNYYRLQDITNDICNTATILDEGSQMQAIDIRDNNTYWITKLQDGKCWMTENLDLDLSTSTTLTPADTDLTSNWTPASSTADASNVTNNNIPGWNYDATTPYSVDVGKVYWNGTDGLADFLNGGDFGSIFQKDTQFATTGEHGAVGNYYNWPAAIAVNDASGYTDSTFEDITKNPQTSICPKGWRLPTISNQGNGEGSTSEFARLNRLYNRNSTRTSAGWVNEPLRAVRGGYLTGLGQHSAGNYIVYWSSTVSGTEGVAYNFRATPTAVYPTGYSPRAEGGSIRCVAREGYTVEFDANGGSGDMPAQSINTGVPTKLSANTFTPPNGKVFGGWNTASDGSGTAYPNEVSVTNLVATGQSITLYAQWGVTLEAAYGEAGMTKHNGYYKMQDMNSAICDATTIIGDGSRMTAIDTRDNKTYIITKLADGRCWMVQNLALGSSSSITLTPQDSNVITDFVLEPSTSGRFWINSNTTNAANINLNRMHDNGNDWIDSDNKSQSSGTPPSPTQYVGNNYNWYTATAGTGTYEMNTDGANATSSVCPKGWRLPTATAGDGEFRQLYLAYGNLADFISAFSAIYSGMWNSDTMAPGNRGIVGSWWSSTVKDAGDVWHAWLSTVDGLTSRMYHRKYAGYSVRCIAQEGYTVTFDANGGSGNIADQTIHTNTPTKLSANTFTNIEPFAGWNTKPDGTGDSYTNEQEVTDLVGKGETITLYAQWGCPSGNICYSSNGVSSATTMNNQPISATDTSVSLLSSNFTNPGYGFVGWSDKSDWVLNENDARGNGTGVNQGYHIYGPNHALNFISGQFSAPNKGLALYAIWLAPSGNLQNWQGCDSLSVGQVIALKDTRDDSVYTVAKLQDGKCWMTENLHLGATIPLELTPADTDTTNNFTLKTSAWDGCTGEGDGDDPEACNDISNFFKPNRSNNTPHSSVLDGYLYNQYTATAGSATSDKAPAVVSTVTDSICPKGWHLPRYTNATYDDFGDLYVALNAAQPATAGAKNMRAYPSNFVTSGVISYPSWVDQGGLGQYHTGTSMGYAGMYVFYLTNATKASYDWVLKSDYASIRCIAR